MKTFNFSGRVFLAIVLLCYFVPACNKHKDDDQQGSTSAFWSDGYRQYQLKGKVKTVKEVAEYEQSSGDYDLLEYNAQGCLIKNRSCDADGSYSGLTLSYDNQNRLVKVVYASRSNPSLEVAEFEYDGSHNKYIPTNIYSMSDLRLQKGVTSVHYQTRDYEPMVVNYKSGSGNQIVFEGTVGGFSELLYEFGGKDIKIIADCNENYPSHIKFQNKSGGGPEVFITFDSDGMPSEIVSRSTDGKVMTNKYTTIAGFMLMTSEETVDNGESDIDEYTYNDKGYMATKKSYGEYRYSYEYDSQGNWVKRTCEYRDGSTWKHDRYESATREYTYW